MADKEASVFIVDLGPSMADCNNGRTESDLDWSMRYVWDKIATIAQAKRKTWCVGVIGLRTDETNNKYMEGGYENISVLQDLGPVALPDMKKLKATLLPSESMTGDAMSAIIIANEMIVEFTKKNKWDRKVYLVTDGQGAIDGDDIEDIANRINEIGITLTVMSVAVHPAYVQCRGIRLTSDAEAWTSMTPSTASRRRTNPHSRQTTKAS